MSHVKPHPFLLTEDHLNEMYALGVPRDQWPARLGVNERTVQRAEIRFGWREKRKQRRITEEEIATMRRLAGDGVPLAWIAETVGRHPHIVGDILGPDPARRTWSSAWQYILKRPDLLELHHEFMPKAGRAA